MIELRVAEAVVAIDAERGGRLASLRVGDTELLVTEPRDGDSLSWGCYPMVPWAGRIRRGVFTFAGRTHQLPTRRPPHAIHGTVDDRPWRIQASDSTSCSLTTELDHPWRGVVQHDVRLANDGLHLTLRVSGFDEPMPVQVGWHPWFRRPDRFEPQFAGWHPRDADGIAVPEPESPARWAPGRTDDCFVDPRPDGILKFDRAGSTIMLSSSCRHWVVYDEPEHAVCIEPQLGPPNVFAHRPTVLEPGSTLEHWFALTWSPADRPTP